MNNNKGNKLFAFILMGFLPSLFIFYMTGGFEESNAVQFIFSCMPMVLGLAMIMF